MYKNILEILTCPRCQEKLQIEAEKESNGEVIEGLLTCTNYHQWQVEDGIIIFQAQEQKEVNNWNELYKDISYQELDTKIKDSTPQVELTAQKEGIREIINIVKKKDSTKILDIATGRGMLLTELVQEFGSKISLVAVDLSARVLKYDRLKCKELNPKARINFIACDATELPILKDSLDLSVSFFGIQNMGSLIPEGIKEGVRVSKKGLINTGYIIKDDNPEIPSINKKLKKAGYDIRLDQFTESYFRQSHKLTDDYKINVKKIFEGIGGNNKNDLIPIKDMWFALAISETILDY
ncbi:class I SAM-dependent methyltransferase [Halanaerobiaceae bacterium Z-7014]|uniref:Class I SAM-dependent methyltransferase n=1 Tax=Halonatronomonas betaini TaxID=2778430 RepID=A0A931APN4_9FIRM|nr:class I SAM-dependent methyltransferase [Halonatronomonas betaini]MBF8435531.1 class I SAM-dependent methyltransferase [Halonatronomonas betaini]